MKFERVRSARAIASALGSASLLLFLTGAPALAGDRSGDLSGEMGGDRERRDRSDDEDTVLGEPSDHQQPDPAGSTGRGFDREQLGADEGRPTPPLRQGADVPIPGDEIEVPDAAPSDAE